MSRHWQQWLAASLSFLFLLALTPVVSAGSATAANSDDTASGRQQRADAHLQLALAYYQQNQWQIALDETATALRIMPREADAMSMRGLIYMASGRQAMAGKEFLDALRIAPHQPDYLNNYAWFLCQGEHPQEALEWFERAAGQPGYSTPEKALNNAGACSLKSGDRQAAIGYFRQALALKPADVRGNMALAELYLGQGDYSLAGTYAARATDVAKPGVEALWLAIKVARKSVEPAIETGLLAQLRSLYPTSVEYAAYQRGVFDE